MVWKKNQRLISIELNFFPLVILIEKWRQMKVKLSVNLNQIQVAWGSLGLILIAPLMALWPIIRTWLIYVHMSYLLAKSNVPSSRSVSWLCTENNQGRPVCNFYNASFARLHAKFDSIQLIHYHYIVLSNQIMFLWRKQNLILSERTLGSDLRIWHE